MIMEPKSESRFSQGYIKNQIAGGIILLLSVGVVFFVILTPQSNTVTSAEIASSEAAQSSADSSLPPATVQGAGSDSEQLPATDSASEIAGESTVLAKSTIVIKSKPLEESGEQETVVAVAAEPAAVEEVKVAPKEENPPEPANNTAKSGSTAKINWYVQVGSFATRKNAEELQAKVEKNQYQAILLDIKTDKFTGTRVLLGPYGSKDHAEKVKNKVVGIKELNIKDVLIREISMPG